MRARGDDGGVIEVPFLVEDESPLQRLCWAGDLRHLLVDAPGSLRAWEDVAFYVSAYYGGAEVEGVGELLVGVCLGGDLQLIYGHHPVL